MKTKIQKSVLGGLVGTAVMTLVIFLAPMMGMPKMNPAEMLSSMMGVPILIGWIMHFMTGIIFALGYVFLLSNLIKKINSKVLKGAIFGIVVFIFAQVMMTLMEAVMGGMPAPQGNMLLMFIGSVMGHLVYGIVTVLSLGLKSISSTVSQPLGKLQA